MDVTPRHFTVLALWVIWCSVHSLLITPKVTDYLKYRLGGRFRFYRLFFNTVAVATICPLVLYSFLLKEAPIFVWDGPMVFVQYGLLALSAFLFLAGATQYSLSSFLGLDQIREGNSRRALSPRPAFTASGILGVIRHPWYAGGFLFIWAREIGLTALLINLVCSLYLVIGTFLEERKLIKEYGDDYRHYQNQVSMLFPWKWIKKRVNRST